MHAQQLRWWSTLALVLLVAVPRTARAQDAEVVIQWNGILQTALGTTVPVPSTNRHYSLLHIAMFDALNSIDPRYTPYAGRVDAAPGASREAAAAQAAHAVLSALFPNQRPTFDAALAATLSRLPSDAARDGVRVGAAAAQAVLELRQGDGWERVPPQFLLPDLPGYWQPTPPAAAAATFTHYPDVTGFVIGSARQFLVEPPPALTSERYAADLNDVKAVGAVGSTIRTEDQTLVARLWASVGTPTQIPAIWSNVVRDLARTRGLSGLETARALTLMSIAMHDSLLVSFPGKFIYGLWRPVTAIRGADRDGNAATEADPTWTPLINTPPYPTYPGNVSCLGGSAARVLERVFGRDNIPFTATWAGVAGAPGWTRSYNGFREMADESGRSRQYAGIHFSFDRTASFGVCTPLGDYAVDNYLRSRFPTQ